MDTGPGYLVGMDVTPLRSEHAIRGIGRYVSGVLEAVLQARPEWAAAHLGLMAASGQSVPAGWRAVWRTHRSEVRPQDVDWLAAGLFDRLGRGRKVDLWHETDPGSPFGIARAGRAMVTAYDLIPLHEPEVMARIRPHRRIPYRLYLRRLRAARSIVAISQSTADDVEATLRVARERIHVVYPWVRSFAQRPGDGGEAATEPALLFVGVPDPHKRPELAIETLAAYRAIGGRRGLAFVGYQPPKIRAHLQARAASLGLSGAVSFHDRISDEKLAELYRHGIVLAISRREGFGLPPVECLLTGGRAVAVPRPIYREVLGDSAVFASEETPDAIAAAALIAEAAAPSASALGELAARYSAEAVASSLIAAYETSLA